MIEPTRILISADDGQTVLPSQTDVIPDYLFVRPDGWVLGAPASLAGAAYALWKDEWLSVIERRLGIPMPASHYNALSFDGHRRRGPIGKVLNTRIVETQLAMLREMDRPGTRVAKRTDRAYCVGKQRFSLSTGDRLYKAGRIEALPGDPDSRIISVDGYALLARLASSIILDADRSLVERVLFMLLSKPTRGHRPWLSIDELLVGTGESLAILSRALLQAFHLRLVSLWPCENPSAARNMLAITATGEQMHLALLGPRFHEACETPGRGFVVRLRAATLNVQGAFPGKLAIAEAYDAVAAYYQETITLAAFKRQVLDAAGRDEIDLTRLDLPDLLPDDIRRRSEIDAVGGTVHFITFD